MSAMKRLFQIMADKKASDIFMSVGAPINIKINGVAMPVNQAILNGEAIKTLLYEVLTERQVKEYEEEMELNTAFSTVWLTGTALPLILMLIGEPTDRKMSEAFLSDISWNRRFIADICHSPRSRENPAENPPKTPLPLV